METKFKFSYVITWHDGMTTTENIRVVGKSEEDARAGAEQIIANRYAGNDVKIDLVSTVKLW